MSKIKEEQLTLEKKGQADRERIDNQLRAEKESMVCFDFICLCSCMCLCDVFGYFFPHHALTLLSQIGNATFL